MSGISRGVPRGLLAAGHGGSGRDGRPGREVGSGGSSAAAPGRGDIVSHLHTGYGRALTVACFYLDRVCGVKRGGCRLRKADVRAHLVTLIAFLGCSAYPRVADIVIRRALRKEPLTVYGDGKQTRSFQYVSDLVEGLIRLMEGEHVGSFNLGNPGEFTMLELTNVMQETIDPSAKIEFRPNTEDDPHKRKPDITRAKELLG
ncbi:hypothetical protein C4D60_Mb08t22860 [Musa balbisiana]|uniref:NAD-dependent epimerase/dehydratase domain-containing protein n=1 Tax=Musa balbisiana TaxID=52838 RepID=A0A4S8K5T0_MUSBA|nr:hypothetical protein C4D60_Mb08t22860 [Musa balbisiana]